MYKLKEDEKYIYADNKDLIIDNFPLFYGSKYGSNSNIYYYKLNKLLKMTNEVISIKKIDTFELIRSLDIKSTIKPDKYLLINENFFGYTMNKATGKIILNIAPGIKYDTFIKSLDGISSDVLKLAKNQIITKDINCFNILYDKCSNNSTLVDLDGYYYDKDKSVDLIRYINLNALYNTIFYTLAIGKNVNFNFDSNLFRKIEHIILDNSYFNSSILDHFKYIKNIIENTTNEEIVYISDLRKVFKYY